mgnify:CR=1 FL=1
MANFDLFSVFSRLNEDLKELTIFPNREEKDLSRGNKNAISKEAFSKVDKEADRQKVLSLIDGNLCTFEIAEILKKPIHKISGRFTWLKSQGLIMLKGYKIINNSKYSVYEKTK